MLLKYLSSYINYTKNKVCVGTTEIWSPEALIMTEKPEIIVQRNVENMLMDANG